MSALSTKYSSVSTNIFAWCLLGHIKPSENLIAHGGVPYFDISAHIFIQNLKKKSDTMTMIPVNLLLILLT